MNPTAYELLKSWILKVEFCIVVVRIEPHCALMGRKPENTDNNVMAWPEGPC